MTAIALRSDSDPRLGGTCYFDTSGIPANVKNPRIEVLAYQNDSLVYGEAGAITDGFLLGGGGSLWLTAGGPAHCVANLFWFDKSKGQQVYRLLATTSFEAAG